MTNSKDSYDPDELFDQAEEKFKNGDYQGAIDDFSKAIEINPNDAL